MMSELLALVYIGYMHLDNRGTDGTDGILQSYGPYSYEKHKKYR